MFLIFEGIIKSPVKLEHPENAEPPIDVTVSGIINFPSNPVHSINAWNPIDVTPFGILISPVSLLQK